MNHPKYMFQLSGVHCRTIQLGFGPVEGFLGCRLGFAGIYRASGLRVGFSVWGVGLWV